MKLSRIIAVLLLLALLVGGVQAVVNATTMLYIPGNQTANDYSALTKTGTSANWTLNSTIKMFGASSLFFNGTGNYLRFPAHNDFNISTTDTYEIRMLVNSSNTVNSQYFFTNHAYQLIYYPATPAVGLALYRGESVEILHTDKKLVQNIWNNITLTRSSGGLWTLYVNGTSMASGTYAESLNSTSPMVIGAYESFTPSVSWFSGNIDEIIFRKGGNYDGTVVINQEFFDYEKSGVPAVSFTATPTIGVNPLTVVFNDTTTSGSAITYYNTSFGDGTWRNDTTFPATNITHVYSTADNYTVDWYVSNAEGTGSATSTITVWGAANSVLSLFNAAGTAPFTTYLYDTSTNLTPGPVTYYTSLGDGNTSTASAFYYTWNATGTYAVNHSVSNGLSTSWYNQTVTVGTPTPPVVAPVASFYGGPQTGGVPLRVSFTDVSSNTPTSWFWEFGDGTNSTSQNPEHVYSTSGFKTVALTATNSAGSNVTTRLKFVRVS